MHPPTWLTTILLLLSPLTTALATAVFPVHAVSPRGHLIAPRQDTNISSDKLGCGRFSTTNHWDVSDLLDAMHASTQPDDCTTPAGTCRRVACVNTSGVYVRPSPLPRPHPAVYLGTDGVLVYRSATTRTIGSCSRAARTWPTSLIEFSINVGVSLLPRVLGVEVSRATYLGNGG